MLTIVQHKRIFEKAYKQFAIRTSWHRESKRWLDRFNELSEEDREILLIQFYKSQATTIINNMNMMNSYIHVPHLGNFTITVQKLYTETHKEALKDFTLEEKRELLINLFGTDRPLRYNPAEHNDKLSIKPTHTKRETTIL